MSARGMLIAALVALAALYAAWFAGSTHSLALLAFLMVPPLLLAVLCLVRPALGNFWSGVLALLWFCHGVMVAWSRQDVRGFALAEIALALVVIFAANFTALRARSAKRGNRAA